MQIFRLCRSSVFSYPASWCCFHIQANSFQVQGGDTMTVYKDVAQVGGAKADTETLASRRHAHDYSDLHA
jgi:hypothetical protein